jgi:hypothetical protein
VKYLTRTRAGDYRLSQLHELKHETRVFFRNHEGSREALTALFSMATATPVDVAEERVEKQFLVTRGRRFKIPEPQYRVEYHTQDSYGNPRVYKGLLCREQVGSAGREVKEGDITVEVGDLEPRYLLPYSYGV